MMELGTAWRTGARLAAAAACAVLALAGCGVGVVGTGSGAVDAGRRDIEYTPKGVCTADFASLGLRCSTLSEDPFRGSSPVQWADADKSRDASAVAVIEGNSLSLQVPCRQGAFLGQWGELADGTLGFVGRYVSPDAVEGRPAVVHLVLAPSEPQAVGWLQMIDGDGATLFGPVLMRPVAGDVALAACVP